MKKRIIGISILILLMVGVIFGSYYIIIAISPGQYDYDYEVGNGSYILVRSSEHDITVSPKDGFINEAEIIPEKVVEIAWNHQYVIAKQYGMKRESQNRKYEIPDETIINYWILDTENKEIDGPFSYGEFVVKLKKLNIEDLKLKPVRYYLDE